ncbi:BH3-interacting domain death agonist isoform X2 [Antechinus flavipes]|uniref:BH3-interacting domain death agonist isoform X2 n=1 Tax=Antechinus flavipes TaxID=38775 RepID=UPI0022354BDD|nr:BH3-interacting domain death agonist isoform X2 [Antechinus flavipes]
MDQDNGQTSLLLYNFLQCSGNNLFQKELKELDSELAVFVSKNGCSEQEYELQTDGNRCYFDMSREEVLDSESQEVLQRIATHLAQIGDKIDSSIQPRLVDNLIQQFRNINLPAEDKKRFLDAAMEQMMQTIPLDLEREKAQLLLAMLLAKKVMTHAPSLFRSIFYITVDYINQNLITYIRNLIRNDMD